MIAGLLGPDGRLRRSWKDGRASADGVLEDYANLAEGLLALYEATGEERWYGVAVGLVESILGRFADPDGGFWDTAEDGEPLVTRPRGLQDNAVPSGAAMATTVLLRLAALTGEGRYRVAAERALATAGPFLARYPTSFAQWLVALEFAHADVVEVALVGDAADPAAQGAPGRRGPRVPAVPAWSPRARRRTVRRCRCWRTGSRSTAGRRPTCAAGSPAACPVTEPEALVEQLAAP